ncbi:MAG: immunoglobulin domain-containing protein, partial [Limisphaerales bacterium]
MNAYLLQAQWKRRAGGLVSVWLMAFLGGAAFAQGPANDDFANATLLSGTNLAVTGTTLNATAEPGEPPHCGHPAAHSIWYTWTAPANGSVLIDLTDSMPGSTVSVYTGKYLTTLVSIDCNVDGNPDATGRCIFPVTAGLVYEIAIDITGGPGGPVNMFLVFTSSVFPPIITAQPASQSTVQGASPIFSVVASGVPAPAYQWLFEGVDLPGATNSTLLLTNVALSQTGPYQVIASNPGGSVTSVVATLTVIPRPANDDFADRVQLNGTNIITAGSNTYATVEPGEPVGGWSGVQSVWWTWTAPTNGIVNVSAANFTGNQVLFIFTGEELTNLQLVASANSFSPPVAVQFETGTGTNFQIAVEGVFNDGGNFQLDLNFTASNFPPVFLCQPSNVTVLQGGSATFSVCVSSALPYSLQWFFDGNPLAGATNSSLVLNNVLSNKEGTYTVLVSSASGSVLGNPASLTVNVPPANDDLANRTPISGLSFSTTGDNQFATSEPGEPDHGGFPPGASVWWSWTTPSIGEAHVSVTGFSGEETLGVYTNAQLASLASVVSNVWTNGPLTVHFNAAAGETYQIAVADPSGLGGPFQLQVLLNLSNFPPTIVQQPPPVTNVAAGSVIYFTNVVDSDFWVTNVWYFETSTNGPAEAIGGWGIDGWGDGGGPGGSGDGSGWGGDGGGGGGDGFGGGDGGGGGYNLSLGLTNLESGYYYTVVTSYGGSVTSSPTYLIVHFPPSNDDFTNRIPLSGVSLSAPGTTAYATLEAGEPAYPGLTSGGSVWWTWTAPANGTAYVGVTNTNAAFQVLEAFTGNALTNLVSVAEAGGAQYVVAESFPVTTGMTYQIAVAGEQSAITVGLQFESASAPPVITQQPYPVTVPAGGSAFFQVGAAGGGMLLYQWYFNTNTLLAGATNSVLQLSGVTTNEQGFYSVSVGNLVGSTNSQQAYLTVTLRPPNDNFANRIALTGTNASTAGSDQYATFETGEPAPGAFSNAKSVWWTYTAPADGKITITLTNYTGDQILSAYTGGSLLSLKNVATEFFYQTNSGQPISVQFSSASGTTFQIQVEELSGGGANGSFDLSLLFTPEIFPPVITNQPTLTHAVTNGNNVVLQVGATGAPPISYQWLFNGANLPGETNTVLELDNVATSAAGSYSVLATNPGGTTASQTVNLIVHQRPPNDFFTNRIALSGELVQTTGSNFWASAEPGEPAHAGYGSFATVWWSYTTTNFGLIKVDLTGSFSGADLGVYTGTNVGELTLVASNAFGNPDGTGAVTFLGQPGTEYEIAVQGALKGNFPVAGSISLSVAELLPPAIVDQPANQYVGSGENAIFEVEATSTSPLTYQWQFGGANLPNQTNSTLIVSNAEANNAGSYSVVVGNAVGNVQSSNVLLTLVSVLTGEVTDAVTGLPLPGVRIMVGTNTTSTDALGDYRIPGVSAGVFADFTAGPRSGPVPLTVQFTNLTVLNGAQLVAVTNGYANYTNDTLQLATDDVVTNVFSMSPLLPEYPMHFVLNWAAQPRDLDGHLLIPAIDGTSYHVYYPPQYRGSLDSLPFAELNTDVTNGYGPETITVAQFFPGLYSYFVEKFAGIGDLNSSKATVEVYNEEALLTTFEVPTNGTGNFWYVCDIDGETMAISPVNEIQSAEPAMMHKPVAPRGGGWTGGDHPMNGSENPSYLWDFGDGTTSTEENPLKTYNNRGVYSVALTVVAGGMTNSLLRTNYINVSGTSSPPGVALVAPSPGALFALGTAITLSAAVTPGTGEVTNVAFYDGTMFLGQTNQSPYTIIWTNAPPGSNGLTAIVSSSDGLSSASGLVSVTVDIPPAITQQPTNLTVPQGAAAQFTVVATGTVPLSYQWEVGGAPLPGATKSTLVLTNVQPSQMGKYSVVVTNLVGAVTSSAAALRVRPPNAPQVLITNPVAGSIFKEGVPIPIDAQLIPGTGAVTNVSFYDGTLLLGQTNQSPYAIIWTNLPPGSNGLTAIVSSADGLAGTSAVVSITVDIPPAIVQQPTNQTVLKGASVTFIVAATGSAPLSYQWELGGAPLPGATNTTLVLTNVQPSQMGKYSVVVTNLVGAVTSSAAALRVQLPDAPQVLITNPVTGSVLKEGVPITIDTQLIPGTGAVTNVSFYDGTVLLGETNLSPYSIIWTNAPAGSNGLTAVAIANGGLVTTSAVVSITVDLPPVISQQPASQTVPEEAKVTFTVGATGTAPLFYQWELDGNVLAGASNATLVLSNVQITQSGNYTVIVTNIVGAVTSQPATLNVLAQRVP